MFSKHVQFYDKKKKRSSNFLFFFSYLIFLLILCMIRIEMELARNKAAFFHYEIVDTLTVGMVLPGWAVKSLRAKNAHLKSAWVRIREGELFLQNAHISPWKYSNEEVQTIGEIKLLAHKKEIQRLQRKIDEKRLTLVPLKIYTKGRHIKCEIGLGKGRKQYEKKQVLKNRSQKREAQQALKRFNG